VHDGFLDDSFRVGAGVQKYALDEAVAQKLLGVVVSTETVTKR
jgi:hypothetical protein